MAGQPKVRRSAWSPSPRFGINASAHSQTNRTSGELAFLRQINSATDGENSPTRLDVIAKKAAVAAALTASCIKIARVKPRLALRLIKILKS